MHSRRRYRHRTTLERSLRAEHPQQRRLDESEPPAILQLCRLPEESICSCDHPARPEILGLAETIRLAMAADSIMLVIRWGRTERHVVQFALDALRPASYHPEYQDGEGKCP